VHLVEAIGDLLERLAEALLEGRLQLLVDGRAHLLELPRVVGAQRFQVLRHARADGLEPLLVRHRERREAIAELLQLLALDAAHAGQLLGHRLAELREPGRELAPGDLRAGRLLLPRDRKILSQVALEIDVLRRQHLEAGAHVSGIAPCGVARGGQRGQARKRDRREHDDGGKQHKAEDDSEVDQGFGHGGRSSLRVRQCSPV